MGNTTVISVADVDVTICFLHTVLFVVITISLLLQWLARSSHVQLSYQLSHTARTILMLALIVIQVMLLLKDILSEMPRISSYVASLLTVVGTSAALVYSDTVGNIRPLSVARLLLLYWFICMVLQLLLVIVYFLLQLPIADTADVCVLLDTLILLIYLGLVLVECTWIIRNVSIRLISMIYCCVSFNMFCI